MMITLCGIPSYAESSFIFHKADTNKCVSIDVIKSTCSQYKATIKINKINSEELLENGGKYIKLWFDELHTLQNIGEPALPIIVQHIGLPHNCTYNVQIINETWERITINRIYPFQGYIIWLSLKLSFSTCSEIHGEFHGAWEERIILFPPTDPRVTRSGLAGTYMAIPEIRDDP